MIQQQPTRPAIRVVRGRYDLLFPECQQDGCYGLVEGRGTLCSKCASDLEFEQRMAAKRAAVGGATI